MVVTLFMEDIPSKSQLFSDSPKHGAVEQIKVDVATRRSIKGAEER